MQVRLGRHFIVEVGRGGVYVRIPFVGAAFIGRGLTSFDRWSVVKASSF